MSVKAQDRPLKDWFNKIEKGEIKLPRFQRHEAWDRGRISGLLETVLRELPLGITLILEVGDEAKFIDRYLETAPQTNGRVIEHLLDGQQRLTAFWRTMHNNYENETYFVYLPEFDQYYDVEKMPDQMFVYCQTRWVRNGKKYPIWCGVAESCFKRGMFPTDLFHPDHMEPKIKEWVNEALKNIEPNEDDPDAYQRLKAYNEQVNKIEKLIKDYSVIIAHYNLPYLALPPATEKDVALQVFINMNTNSKPLSLYDIIVAEVESVKGKSLHDLENDLDSRHPNIKEYYSLSDLILSTSALLQGKLPNRKGALDMDKEIMVDKWGKMERGLAMMANFLESQKINDRQRLPTNAVLAVIASLYDLIPDSGDLRGKSEHLLKKYLWSSFFTDRYENSAATHAYYDYLNLKRVLNNEIKENGLKYNEEDIPVLNREKHPLAELEELQATGWPKNENIRARAILAVSGFLGAFDFADGQTMTRSHLHRREYHHIFPKALLEEAEINPNLALNCALITNTTNRTIGRKDPLEYLKDRYEWVSEEIVDQRLQSFLIPKNELKNGGYHSLTEEQKKNKIDSDFDLFIKKRAEYIKHAAGILCEGKTFTVNDIIA
jgi:hypothetical protein